MAVRVGVSLLLKGVVSIIHRHRFALLQHLMAASASVTLTDASAMLAPPNPRRTQRPPLEAPFYFTRRRSPAD